MSRHIDFEDLSDEDLQYLEERPWLKTEYELQSGQTFGELLQEQGKEGLTPAGRTYTDAELEKIVQDRAAEIAGQQPVQQAGDGPTDDYPSYADKPRPEGWENFSDEEKRAYVYGSDEASYDYDNDEEWPYNDLLAEVSERNGEREDDDKIRPASRSREDVIAALRADDEANAE